MRTSLMKIFRYFTVVLILVGTLGTASYLWSQNDREAAPVAPPSTQDTATLAGGCFWCIEAAFKELPGVVSVTSGYAGGDKPNPKYEEVASGNSGYVETVRIVFDNKRISFDDLLEVYWRQINPTDAGGQFVDRGPQYQAIIYYHDASQRSVAEKSKAALEKSGRFQQAILTPIQPYKNFYPAEDYHQSYFRKNPLRYKMYHQNSGRDSFFKKIWGELKKFGS